MKLKIVYLFLIFLVLFCFISKSYATDYTYTQDPTYLINTLQENQRSTIENFVLSYYSSSGGSYTTLLYNAFKTYSNYYVFVYSPNYAGNTLYVGFYLASSSNTLTTGVYQISSETSVPTDYYTIADGAYYVYAFQSYYTSSSNVYRFVSVSVDSFSVPVCLYKQNWSFVREFVELIDGTGESSLSDVQASIESTQQTIEETNDILTNANEFLQEDIDTETELSIDTETITDPTEDSFSQIFDLLKNAFSTTTDLQFELLGETVTISSDLISSNMPDTFVNLINVFWYAFIGLFIYKDISHIIEKLSTGEINSISTSNLKADLF